MVLLPRSLLNEATALDAERESNDFLSGLTKSIGDTFAQLAPKPAPEPAAPAFPPIDDSIIQQPVPGPSMAAPEAPMFTLPDDSTFLGTRPEPQPTMGARPITGTESVPSNGIEPVQRGPVDDGSLQSYARQAATRAGIDPEIFVRQIQQESGFNPSAVSTAGARGVAQIVPKWHPGVNPDNPTEALDYAANLMASHLKQYGGDYGKALAAYNAGPGAVEQYGGVPPFAETQKYVSTILGDTSARRGTDNNGGARVDGGTLDFSAIQQQYVGKPYVFGGGRDASGGIPGAATDCSGFVSAVFRERGVALPAHTDAAYNAILKQTGRQVSEQEARPGDVVFYMGAGTGGAITHHMGIYEGPGKVLDMSSGGVKSRPIGHAGEYVILRDSRINPDTPSPTLAKGEPIAPNIVPTGIAEETGGQKPSEKQIDQWSQMAASFKGGLSYEQAMADEREFTGRGGMAMEPPTRDIRGDYEPSNGGATTIDGSALGAQVASSDSGFRGDTVGSAGNSQTGGHYLPNVPYGVADNVEPGDFAIPGRPLTASATQPGDAVDPVSASQAPASSGNPIVDLFSDFGRKLSGILQPQKPDLSIGAVDIQQRTTTQPDGPLPLDFMTAADPSASRQLLTGVVQEGANALGTGLNESRIGFQNLASDVTGGVIPEGSPDRTRREAVRFAQDWMLPTSGLTEVRGLGAVTEDAINRLRQEARGGFGIPAPAPGIISGAQADDAGRTMARGGRAMDVPGWRVQRGPFGPEYMRETAPNSWRRVEPREVPDDVKAALSGEVQSIQGRIQENLDSLARRDELVERYRRRPRLTDEELLSIPPDAASQLRPHQLTRDELADHLNVIGQRRTADVEPVLRPQIQTLDELQQAIKAADDSGTPVYFRRTPNLQGDIRRGYSLNHATGEREAGLSANHADPTIHYDLEHVADVYSSHGAYDLRGTATTSKSYLITGKVVGTGADGEELLAPRSIRVVAEISPRVQEQANVFSDLTHARHYPNDEWVGHKKSVADALSRGEPVPDAVLREYPDLAERYGRTLGGEPPNATAGTPGGLLPGASNLGAGVARGAAQGAVAGGYEASQQEGAGPLDIARGAAMGGAEGAVLGGARRAIGPRGVANVARAVQNQPWKSPYEGQTPQSPPSPTEGLPVGERLRRAFVRAWTDDRVDLAEVQKEAAEAIGRPLNADEMVTELSRRNPLAAAEVAVKSGPFRDAVQSVGENVGTLEEVLTYRHNVDVANATGNQNRKFSGGLTAAESQKRLDWLEQNMAPAEWKTLDDATKQIRGWVDDYRQRMVDAGVWTQELADDLKTKYPNYAPTKIVDYMKDPSRIGVGKSVSLRDRGLRQLTEEGTEAARETPLASLIRYAAEAEATINKNEVYNAFVKLGQQAPDVIPMRKVPSSYTAKAGEKLITGFENGVRTTYVTTPPIEAAVQLEASKSVPFLSDATRLFRELITRSPIFVAGQVPMDAMSFMVRETARENGNAPRAAIELVRAYVGAFKGLGSGRVEGDLYRYLREGAGMAGIHDRSAKAMATTLDDVTRKNMLEIRNGQDLQRLMKWIGTFEWSQAVGQRVEMAPRLAAGRLAEQRALREGAKPDTATLKGVMDFRDVTLDFQRGGTWARTINQAVPFFNVGWQSAATVQRAWRENPKAFPLTAMALIGGPTAAAEAWNRADEQRSRDYDDVPDYVKDRGIVFMLPGVEGEDAQGNRRPNYALIPLRELSPFAILAREAVSKAMGNDTRGAQALIGAATSAVSPIQANNPADFFNTFTPFGISTGLQLSANRDMFRDRDIATERNDEEAAAFSKALAERLGVRPSQVEFAIRDLGGYAGSGLLATSDAVTGNQKPGTGGVQDLPVVGGLAKRYVGNAIGQGLQDARDQMISSSVRSALDQAGMRDDQLSAVRGEIAGLKLTRVEQTQYQDEFNRVLDGQVSRLLAHPRWESATREQREQGLRNAIESARQAAKGAVVRENRGAMQERARSARQPSGGP